MDYLGGCWRHSYGLDNWRRTVRWWGELGLLAALIFWRSLPKSMHFRARAEMSVEDLVAIDGGADLLEPGLGCCFWKVFCWDADRS